MPVPLRHRTEVLWCFKYPIFVFNLLLWFFGIGILAVGVWSWSEKERFSNLSRATHIALDPAFMLIVIGTITVFIGFTGCVGALRELPGFLTLYVFSLLFLLLFEVSFVVIFTNFKDWIKSEATEGFQSFIVHYREDPDQQNLIDWVQEEWLQCCGIEGPKDWDKNNYFNCSSQEIGSREACGVPFSCCKRKPNEIIKNKQCGYDVRKNGYYSNKRTSLLLTQDESESPIYEQGCIKALDEWIERHYIKIFSIALVFVIIQNNDVSKIIYEKGCIQALEDWFEHNLLLITAGVLLSTFIKLIAVLQTQRFRAEMEAYKESYTLPR